MKQFLIFIAIGVLIFSCGKKRVITEQGEMMLNDKQVRWEISTERDTCFKYFYDNGRVIAVATAKNIAELKDSTFAETDFAINGKISHLKFFHQGKPDGIWTSFYPDGKRKSISLTKNETLVEYQAWYDNGQEQISGKRLPNGKMKRLEFFKGGTPSQEFEMDSTGSGYCTSYFMNGKKREQGNIFNFSPIGIWNRFDSLGNKKADTLLGIRNK